MEKNRYIHRLQIVLFSVVIFLPLFATMFPVIPHLFINENRTMSTKPTLSLRTIHTFPEAYEKYYNDSFAFRPWLIRAHNHINISILQTSTHPKIIIGKNGWFFFNSEGPLQREKLFTDSELTTIRENMEKIKQTLAEHNVRFYLFITPDSQTIYPEYLPDYLDGTQSRLNQLILTLNKNDSSVVVIDPRKALMNSKNIRTLYRKYDTHWNEYGAFVAYQELIRHMSIDFPAISPKSADDFSITYEKSPNNDLLNMLAINGYFEESIPILKPKESNRATQKILSCRFKPNCEKIQATVEDFSLPKLLMYRDSFSNKLTPFISEHFRESHYLWTHQISLKDIDEYKPDIVVLQIVERDLSALKKVQAFD